MVGVGTEQGETREAREREVLLDGGAGRAAVRAGPCRCGGRERLRRMTREWSGGEGRRRRDHEPTLEGTYADPARVLQPCPPPPSLRRAPSSVTSRSDVWSSSVMGLARESSLPLWRSLTTTG